MSQGRLPLQKTFRSDNAVPLKAPSMDTSGTPQVHEIRIERREAVLPLVRSRISPPQNPARPSCRFLRCTHFQYGKSSMWPLTQAMTKREGTRSSSQSPHSFFPGGELNCRTC